MTEKLIRGLSLTLPWPFAFANGKRVENRSWRPTGKLTGCYVALHAAQSYSEDDRGFIQDRLGNSIVVPGKESPHSQIFAVARWNGVIVLSEPQTDQPDLIGPISEMPADQEKWFFGPFGWLLEDYVELPEPVACKGAQLLWAIPPDALQAVREQYRAAMEAKR